MISGGESKGIMLRAITIGLAVVAGSIALAEVITLDGPWWLPSFFALILALVVLLRAVDQERQRRLEEEADRDYQRIWEALERGELPP